MVAVGDVSGGGVFAVGSGAGGGCAVGCDGDGAAVERELGVVAIGVEIVKDLGWGDLEIGFVGVECEGEEEEPVTTLTEVFRWVPLA